MSELHTIALMFRGSQRQVNLVFASAVVAGKAFEGFLEAQPHEYITQEDSFGTEVALFAEGPLEAIVLQDAGRASEGGIEMGLLQARAQSKAQKRAQSDVMINLSSSRAIMPGGH